METNPVKRMFNDDGTRVKGFRAAIDAKCANCCGNTTAMQGEGFIDHYESGFREGIRNCTVTSCPLHHLRPFQQ